MTLRQTLALSAPFLAALPISAQPAHAQLCDYFFNCCMQLVGAYEEAGVPATRVEQFEYACHLHDRLAPAPQAQHMFCEMAWERISREAFLHFTQGRIGFYPDDCFDLPMEDPEDVLSPMEDLAIQETDFPNPELENGE